MVLFFTADKNICLDINLVLCGSLPLLAHHPSSFSASDTQLTPQINPSFFLLPLFLFHSDYLPPMHTYAFRQKKNVSRFKLRPLMAPLSAPHRSARYRHPSDFMINSRVGRSSYSSFTLGGGGLADCPITHQVKAQQRGFNALVHFEFWHREKTKPEP